MHLYSSNPEMFAHLESNIALFRNINSILKKLGYHDFKYGAMLKPSLFTCVRFLLLYLFHKEWFIAASSTVKDVLVGLVNFLAYFEAEEANKEQVETEIQNLKQLTIQYEKRLLEDEKYLSKCQQVLDRNIIKLLLL